MGDRDFLQSLGDRASSEPVRNGHRLLILIARNEEAFDPLGGGPLEVCITGAPPVA